MEEIIYFDNAATTFPKPQCVYEKMDQVNRTLAFNAGRGSYALAREAMKLIEEVRCELLDMAGGRGRTEVILTPSATASCNQIIGGMEWKETDVVYVSPFEHNAIMRPLHQKLQSMEPAFQVIEIPLKTEEYMEIDLEEMEYLFSKKPPTHVFLSYVSNVTGYILPVEKIAELAKAYQAVTIVDASQALGLLPIDLDSGNIDFLIFAGHKTLYGPLGIGGFFMKKDRMLTPYLAGGTGTDSMNLDMPEEAPARYEAGSPNVVAAGGLLAALWDLKERGEGNYEQGICQLFQQEKQRTRQLAEGLQKISGVKLYLPRPQAHIGMVAFNINGYRSSEVGMILDEDYHIAVRTGYHCAPLVHQALHDLEHAGVVRASIGQFTTEKELDTLLAAIGEIAEG